VAQVVIRESHPDEHLKTAAPWTDFGVWPWPDARYFECRNRGAGAVESPDRPVAAHVGRGSPLYAQDLPGRLGSLVLR
jgi:hypothetical protein